MAAAARLTGRDRLGLAARMAAFAGAGAGTVFLVAELGRPMRFLNMLRVFKLTSPMSVGSWTLAAHSGLAGVAAGSAVTGLLPFAGDAASVASGLSGVAMATYTAVLLADTAVPAWHEGMRELPFLFAGSALASAGAAVMLTTPRALAGPARTAAAAGAMAEIVAERAAGAPPRPGRRAVPDGQGGQAHAGLPRAHPRRRPARHGRRAEPGPHRAVRSGDHGRSAVHPVRGAGGGPGLGQGPQVHRRAAA